MEEDMGVADKSARAVSPSGLSPASGSSQSGIANAGWRGVARDFLRWAGDRVYLFVTIAVIACALGALL